MKRQIELFLSGSKYRGLRRRFYTMVSQEESRFDETFLTNCGNDIVTQSADGQ